MGRGQPGASRYSQILAREQLREQTAAASRAVWLAICAKAPRDATGIILAVLEVEFIPGLADGISYRPLRSVAIGWKYGKRDDFRQLRAAADSFPETLHLGTRAPKDVEQREKWAQGRGFYLKNALAGSGWYVQARSMERQPYGPVEDQLPDIVQL